MQQEAKALIGKRFAKEKLNLNPFHGEKNFCHLTLHGLAPRLLPSVFPRPQDHHLWTKIILIYFLQIRSTSPCAPIVAWASL